MKYDLIDAKSWARNNLRGYIVCTITPFHDDLRLDEDGVRANTRHLLALKSTRGLHVNSVLAEQSALSTSERKRIAELVTDEVAGRVPVLVDVTTESILEAIDMGNHAREIGADLVILGSPVTGLRSRQGVFEYFRQFIEATSIGVLVFSTTWSDVGFYIDTDLLVDLAEFAAVCAVKDATASLTNYLDDLERVAPKLTISRASEQFWLAGRLLMGADRVPPLFVGAIKPIFADALTREFEMAVLESNWDTATRTMLEMVRLEANLFPTQSSGVHDVASTKAVCGLLGMATGPVRPPLTYPNKVQLARARQLLNAVTSR